jgi:hypothetical protein
MDSCNGSIDFDKFLNNVKNGKQRINTRIFRRRIENSLYDDEKSEESVSETDSEVWITAAVVVVL